MHIAGWFFTPLYGSNEKTVTESFGLETAEIHKKVESHPFVKALLGNRLESKEYFSHLVDLHYLYGILEEEMRAHISNEPRLERLYFPSLERAGFLKQDLEAGCFKELVGHPSKAAREYGDHLKELARTSPLLLLSHSYVRYLGDLSGGRFLKSAIAKKWPEAVHFYDFSSLYAEQGDLHKTAEGFKTLYKERLNALSMTSSEKNRLVEEAVRAFSLSGFLFDACYPSSEIF